MNLYILDTIFSLYQNGRPGVVQNIVRHVGDRLAVTVTTADELVSRWQARLPRARTDADISLAEGRLSEIIELLGGWETLPMTRPVLIRFRALRQARLNVKSPDLRIASVALEEGGIVVTRNLRDFRRVPGLMCDDWSV